ncbi:MAG: ArsR family transcriptional regulator [Candidatus Lokiarchaeia archaeon]
MSFAQIDKEILSGLSVKPMSIYEISRRTGRAWKTVRDHLRRLKELGKVECIDQGVDKLWRLRQDELGAMEELQLIGADLKNITLNRVDAKELMYYNKAQGKFRMPLIEEWAMFFGLNFFEALRSVLAKRFGRKMAEEILFDIGREHALYGIKKFSNMLGGGKQSLAENLFKRGVNLEEAKRLFKSVFESQGWFKVIDVELGRKTIFKLENTFESIAYSGLYPCSLLEGFLVGLTEVLFHEKIVRHEEIRCTSKGEDYCEFLVEVASDNYQKLDFSRKTAK